MGIVGRKRTFFGRQLLNDLLHLVYPSSCIACEKELSKNELNLCSECDPGITLTQFHLFDEPSDMDKLFWSRVSTEFTHAHFYFTKNSVSQKVLFNLKYKHNSQIGVQFGRRIGKELLQHPKCVDVDFLIPVPLHPKKQFIRGYNQSEALAIGVSEVTKIKVNTQLIRRITNTDSQTKKSRFERWDNINEAFQVQSSITKAKHIVLVDDVITTGSTIEQIIQLINQINPAIKVSVVTLAIA